MIDHVLMRNAAIVVLSLVLLPLSVVAQTYEDAVDAARRGDYATAVEIWEPLAKQGLSEAQSDLGTAYLTGSGVPQDLVAAVKWFRLAADQGFALGQYNLGLMYVGGKGVPKDYTEAARWFRRAADQGLREAQHNLGFMYVRGLGVPPDRLLAFMWFSLAAEQMYKKSMYNVLQMNNRLTEAEIEEVERLVRNWKATTPDLKSAASQ